jgi:hypothetical protein
MTEHSLNLTVLAESLANGGHSIFAPSASAMWMNCSGSLIPNLLAPDTAGFEAAEGTVAHSCGDKWLKTDKKPKHLIGTVQKIVEGEMTFEILIDAEMLDYVQEYVDWCWVLPGDHYVEQKVYFSQITPIPKQGGTADHTACWYQHMVITDFKYGKGVLVTAKGNTQALLYALGFFYEWDWLYDFQTIEIRIAQPRMHNWDTWTVTRAELLAFAEYAKERAHAAWVIGAPRTPGVKQCSWCNVKPSCAAYVQLMVDVTSGIFDSVEDPVTELTMAKLKEDLEFEQFIKPIEVATLSTDDMAFIWSYRGLMERWWKSLANELLRRRLNGERVRRLKLVESRSKRVLRNPTAALAALKKYGVTYSDLYDTSPKTPAEIERVLKGKGVKGNQVEEIMKPLTFKPAGKPTLAALTDRREEIVDVSEFAFQPEDEISTDDGEL